MSFLEASKLLSNFSSEHKETFIFAMSGTADQLTLFLRSQAAKSGIEATIQTLPFGTLTQFSYGGSSDSDVQEIIFLTSFDLVPEGNWRSGFPDSSIDENKVINEAQSLLFRLASREHAKLFYLPAPLLQLFSNDIVQNGFESKILNLAISAGADVLPNSIFSLSAYLATGCPIGGAQMEEFSSLIWGQRNSVPAGSCKILVTDLDNVMWYGVAAEDGFDGVFARPEGVGYPHYIYQGFLRNLKNNGIPIAAISRNDISIATGPFRNGDMLLNEEDFIAIIASYNAKSTQISALAKQLNLSLDAFVFIDDNPVEIAEVSAALPKVTCLHFSKSSEDLPILFATLARLFRRDNITNEDRQRTELYKRRFESMPLSEESGADLHDFLRGLDMTLELHERGLKDFDRAEQLINKTNQFNLNGIRLSTDKILKVLNEGGRLLTGCLSDRTGSHGEVICCLIDSHSRVLSWVMSCRVFERHLEYAFLLWLSQQVKNELVFAFTPTDRNTPIVKFFDNAGFVRGLSNEYILDVKVFSENYSQSLELFKVLDKSHE